MSWGLCEIISRIGAMGLSPESTTLLRPNESSNEGLPTQYPMPTCSEINRPDSVQSMCKAISRVRYNPCEWL